MKHCAGFPTQSIEYCLSVAGISIAAIEHIGISRNPAARLHKRIFAAGQRFIRRSFADGGCDAAPALSGERYPSLESSEDPTPSNGNGNGREGHLPQN